MIELKLTLANASEKGPVNGLHDVFCIRSASDGRGQMAVRVGGQLIHEPSKDDGCRFVVAVPHTGQQPRKSLFGGHVGTLPRNKQWRIDSLRLLSRRVRLNSLPRQRQISGRDDLGDHAKYFACSSAAFSADSGVAFSNFVLAVGACYDGVVRPADLGLTI
jgi:hypothetical protein